MIIPLEEKTLLDKPHIKSVALLFKFLFLVPCIIALIVLIMGVKTAIDRRGLCLNGSERCINSTSKLQIQDIKQYMVGLDNEAFKKVKVLKNEVDGQFHIMGGMNATNVDGNIIALLLNIDYLNAINLKKQSKKTNPKVGSEYSFTGEYQLEFEIFED